MAVNKAFTLAIIQFGRAGEEKEGAAEWQAAGTTNCCPSKIRLASASEGLTAARQRHAAERPRLDLARLQSVSPLRTLMVLAPLELAPRPREAAARAGRLSWAPARI